MWALGAIALLGSEWLVVRDATWRAVAYAVTAAVLGVLSRLLREQRLWLAGWIVAVGTAFVSIVVLAGIWVLDDAEPMRYAIAALATAAALAGRSVHSPGVTRRAAISSPSPGRPRSSP